MVFQVFKMYNLKINYEKTKAILKVVGTMSSKVHQLIRKHAQERRLLLSPVTQRNGCRLCDRRNILGSSYRMDRSSCNHYAIVWRKPTIVDGPSLPSCTRGKLALATSCKYGEAVLSVLYLETYGLHCCGLTGDQTLEAQRATMRHVRAIVSNQAHLTGDTHMSTS